MNDSKLYQQRVELALTYLGQAYSILYQLGYEVPKNINIPKKKK